MARRKKDQSRAESQFLPLTPDMTPEQMLMTLRVNALKSHQVSMGRGDELVEILKRAVEQVERTHGRIQNLSTVLFVTGLAVLGFGLYQFGWGGEGGEVWGGLGLGAGGGIAALAATFWTAPLEKMSESVSDLVKLEAAFLGYIRVIGELDSAFQMQYLQTLDKDVLGKGAGGIPLDQVMVTTSAQVKDMMRHTLESIDAFVAGPGSTMKALKAKAADFEEKLKKLEQAVAAKNNSAH